MPDYEDKYQSEKNLGAVKEIMRGKSSSTLQWELGLRGYQPRPQSKSPSLQRKK
eukprot:CAMPEP_0116887224 /NCGR_PEP_ID=MMETSP0463-20121206/21514_1 /TAXON_ID=181622 /ORGANISM="Strombidinopsis sp, Strain SopsisLIS2011" /LENGTH=53 /DNA_ID=CAMNT_0004549311 /DNA_START=134 /DNA_END=292 /DNA_ORIENTATION=-